MESVIRWECPSDVATHAKYARDAALYNIDAFKRLPIHLAAFYSRYGVNYFEYQSYLKTAEDTCLHKAEVVAVITLFEHCMIYPPSKLNLFDDVQFIITETLAAFPEYEQGGVFRLTPTRIAFLFEKIFDMDPRKLQDTEWQDGKPGGLNREYRSRIGRKSIRNTQVPTYNYRRPTTPQYPIVAYESSWEKLEKLVTEAKKQPSQAVGK